jgi:hypothetical protein
LFRFVHDAHSALEDFTDDIVPKFALNREESHGAMLGKAASKSSMGIWEIAVGGGKDRSGRFFSKIFVDYLPSFDKVAPLVERNGIPSGSKMELRLPKDFVTCDNEEKRYKEGAGAKVAHDDVGSGDFGPSRGDQIHHAE